MTPEMVEAYQCTWRAGQRMLADPVVRARVLRQLAKLETQPLAPPVTDEQLLALTARLLSAR